jgi:hypothetical protein
MSKAHFFFFLFFLEGSYQKLVSFSRVGAREFGVLSSGVIVARR